MEPATFGAMIATNALVQAYMAHKQMGAEQDRIDAMKAEFDKIKPPEFAGDIEEWTRKHGSSLPDYGSIPSFEFLSPEQYKVIEKYNPQFAEHIKQVDPQTVKRSEIGEEGLSAQRQALRKLMTTGQLDQDPELMQKFAESDRNAQIGAQSRQQSIMQDFARRGQGGSGLQLASQMGAGADAMDRSAQTSQQAAVEAYKNRLNQMMQGAQLGGQMEQNDVSLQGRNTDIINRFNEMTSKNYQDYLNNRANTANTAQQYNISQAQDVANKNVNLQNTAKEKQADMARWVYETNAKKQQESFQNKLAGMSAENAAKTSALNAATAKANAMAGLPTVNKWGYYAPIAQKATDVGTQFAAGKYAQDQQKSIEDRKDARLQYDKTGRWPTEEEG